MRVLLSTYGSRGDVEPLVGLAVQLRALGAEVRACAPPDEDFAPRLAGVDWPMVPFGQSARALTTGAPPPYPGRPFPSEVTDNRMLWDLDAESNNALFGEALNTHRASIGRPPVDNVRDYVIGDQPWLATDPTLDPGQETADLDAGRVADLGIGTAHNGPTPTTESLSVALKTSLTPETRARATAVASTIRTDGAMVAAKLLLDRS